MASRPRRRSRYRQTQTTLATAIDLRPVILSSASPRRVKAFTHGPASSTLASMLYRLGPDWDAPKFRWISVGAVVATALWVVGSVGFSFYVDNFGSYGKTFGTLAGVVVLLLWLWLSSYAALLGAEVNAEMEQQTIKDSTTGEPEPLGQRGAVKADSIPDPADPMKTADERDQPAER